MVCTTINEKGTCFTDLSWFLEIVIIVPEHLSLFLFSCHGYSVPLNLYIERSISDKTNNMGPNQKVANNT